jgi:hypothetical protein
MIFPVFRKYSDNLTYFRIDSDSEFIELKRLGNYFSKTKVTAKIFTDKVYIKDLIDCNFPGIQKASFETYQHIKLKWEKELILFPV